MRLYGYLPHSSTKDGGPRLLLLAGDNTGHAIKIVHPAQRTARPRGSDFCDRAGHNGGRQRDAYEDRF
jgi:hypothetical protein